MEHETRDMRGAQRDAPGTPGGVATGGPAFALPEHLTLIRDCRRSGMGQAMIVENRRTKRIEVLKVASAAILGNPEALRRFREEPRRCSRFNHPGIVTVYDCDESNGVPYFLMEHMNAGSLADRLQDGPLTTHQAAEWIATAARTIDVIHEKGGVAHGDIKPANLLFTQTDDGLDKLKVADFGLTRPLPRDWRLLPAARMLSTRDLPPTGMLAGTPGYIAPELFEVHDDARTAQAGHAADLFALGVTLYQCLTGRLPFQTSMESIDLFGPLVNELTPPSELNPAVDAALDAICQRALKKAPEERFKTARELAVALESWLSQQGTQSKMAVGGRAAEASLAARATPRPGRQGRIALAVGVGVVAVLLGSFFWNDDPRGRDASAVGINTGERQGSASAVLTPAVARLGWPGTAAEPFNRRYGGWLESTGGALPKAEAEDLLARLRLLARGQGQTSAMDLVAKQPELAFALANVREPEAVAREILALGSSEDRTVFLNLLMLYPTPAASDRMLRAWQAHRRAICRMWQHHLAGAEAVFMVDRQRAGDRAYEQWLTMVLDDPSVARDELAQRLQLVLLQGGYLRDRLASAEPRDRDFRERFASTLWPRLCEVTADAKRPLDIFLANRLTWDYLARDDGKELAAEFGLLPAELFVGREPYALEAQPVLKRILKERRVLATDALFDPRLRREPLFTRFLLARQALTGNELCQAVAEIGRSPDVGATLAMLSGMTDDDLRQRYARQELLEGWEDNLPGYLRLGALLAQRRPVDSGDYLVGATDAVADALSYFREPIAAATGGVVPAELIKVVAEVGSEVVKTKVRSAKIRAIEEQRQAMRARSKEDEARQEKLLADALIKQPSLLLRSFLELPRGEREAGVHMIASYFWRQPPVRHEQLALLDKRVGDMYLLPSGRLVCVPASKAGEPAARLVEDTPEAWSEAAATWWQSMLTGK